MTKSFINYRQTVVVCLREGDVLINNPGHMTKMTAMPIYGKSLQKSFPLEPVDRFQSNFNETWHVASGPEVL